MKFLKWLFNLRAKHHWDMARYERGKMATKIFVIVLLLVLAGGTLGVEYWCMNLFNTNFLYGLLVLIFLFIPLTAVSFEYCGLYSYLGFKMFVWGTIESVVNKIDKKKRSEDNILANETSESEVLKAETDENISEKTETNKIDESQAQNTSEQTKPNDQNNKKAHKWIDLLIGILGIVLGVGLLVGVIVLFAVQN